MLFSQKIQQKHNQLTNLFHLQHKRHSKAGVTALTKKKVAIINFTATFIL